MNYVDTLRRSLEQFEKELKEDNVRLNRLYNDLDNLAKKKEQALQEVQKLEETRAVLLEVMKDEKIAHDQQMERIRNETEYLLKKAHELFSQAKSEKIKMDGSLMQAEKDQAQAEKYREFWQAKKVALEEIMEVKT